MSKNPADIKDFEAMKDLAHYWMEKSYLQFIEKKALQAILKEKGIEVRADEFLAKMNQVSRQVTEEWERNDRSKKR